MCVCVCVRVCAQKVPLLQVRTSVSIIHSSVLCRLEPLWILSYRQSDTHHSTTRDGVQSDGSFLTGLILPKRAVRLKATYVSLCVYTLGYGVWKL